LKKKRNCARATFATLLLLAAGSATAFYEGCYGGVQKKYVDPLAIGGLLGLATTLITPCCMCCLGGTPWKYTKLIKKADRMIDAKFKSEGSTKNNDLSIELKGGNTSDKSQTRHTTEFLLDENKSGKEKRKR